VAEVEPNDTTAKAQVLSGAVTVNGTLTASADTDYYKVTIAAGKSLVATMQPNATSDYDLYAYNSAGVRVASATAGAGAADSITLSNTSTTAPLVAYLRVLYFSGGTGASAGKYTLTVK
jgi:hypothetical protein